ncbi:hypothetical protein C8R43DRAFT_855678, partial [Mycena crocata]
MGAEWGALVDLWWRLEESTGFASKTKTLPTTNRPAQIGNWVKHARGNKPVITMPTFANEWGAWWKSINPPWRLRDGELVREGTGSWDCLRYPGQNGLLNIVVGLKWWREGLEEESPAWKDAVADVTWVIKMLME